MVKALHRAGIEVILDVVYNHTAEGNHLGPMLSFKGVDNSSYYRLVPDDERHYMDYTGTGNTLDARHPSVLRLIMDSLRYWVSECHVDGFRFDLASALARELYDVDRLSAFFDTIHQDPILSQVKLIAEPWDVGPGGYQVGNFPVLWSEWNGIYRDVVRDFWRGQSSIAEFASRFTGSSDLYESDGRQPFASINFVTAHDGFTLRDLVTYNEKHNEANGEDNRDGTDDNRSWNCGVEGETDDPDIIELRWRQQRNFLATLFLSQGVPMLLGGDELARTQHGNNNAWCQDNELSWYEWGLREGQGEHLEFTKRLIELRKAHPVFRRGKFLAGRESEGSGLPDVWWFRPDGRRMTQRDWQQPSAHVLGVFLNGQEIADRTPRGEPIEDDSFLLLFNAHHEDMTFTLPARRFGGRVGARARHLRPGARARRAALALARRGARARAVDEAAARAPDGADRVHRRRLDGLHAQPRGRRPAPPRAGRQRRPSRSWTSTPSAWRPPRPRCARWRAPPGRARDVEATLDRRAALEGADYVVTSFQVGGYRPGHRGRLRGAQALRPAPDDRRHVGVGGIMRGLRTIPVLLDVCRDMEELCPDALLLQYVNPMAMLCWAVARASSVRAVGLCHSVQHTAGELAADLGLAPAELDHHVAGINHLAFFLRLERDGEDLYPALREVTPPAGNRVRYEVLRHLGYFVTESSEHFAEYVPWFIKAARPDLVERFNIPLDEYPRRCEAQIAEWERCARGCATAPR